MDLFRSPGIDVPVRPRPAATYGAASRRRYGRLRPARSEDVLRDRDRCEETPPTVDQQFEEYFFE